MILATILFLISFTLVLASSYLITSIFAKKNSVAGLMYVPVVAFAQLVLSFEILSLFNAISVGGVLIFNVLNFWAAYYAWDKTGRALWGFDRAVLERFFNRLKNSFRLDKTLIVLGLCYAIFIVSAFILSFLMPATSGDAKTYHVARSFFYVIQGNLNHFVTGDIRALCLPFNSEILYSWIIVFFKKDILLGYFAFVGYLLTVVASFNLMGLLHFAYRRRLWIIFLLSSFASVIVQVSSTETDIIITALVLSSMYLFWSGVKEGTRVPVYFAALCYALAIGTKTPSILMIPSVGFFMLAICAYYKKLKPFLTFLGFGVVNFVVFSAYNYVLNLVHYGNIAGSEYFMIVSKNYDGFRGACANFIKYLFMFVDFTGFRWSDYLMSDLTNLRTAVLSCFNLAGMQDGIYSTDTHFQRSLIEQLMGAGILGFLVFLPCWIISLFMGLSKKRNRRKLCVFGIMMLINLAVISYSLSYMTYSVRFLMSFMLLSAPVLYYSYFSNRNILKYVIIYFATFYLALVSTHIWVRPFFKVVNFMKTYPSVQKVREVAVCQNFYVEETPRIDCKVRAHIKSYPKDTRFLYLPEAGTNYVGIAKLILEGYRIDIGEAERLSFGEGDLDEYDVIISPATRQRATNIVEYERRKDDFAMDTRFKGETIRVKRQVERPFDCLYEYNPRIDMFDAEGNRRVPYAVRCSAKPAFFKSKGFDIARVVGNKYEEDDGKVSNIYLFYEKE